MATWSPAFRTSPCPKYHRHNPDERTSAHRHEGKYVAGSKRQMSEITSTAPGWIAATVASSNASPSPA